MVPHLLHREFLREACKGLLAFCHKFNKCSVTWHQCAFAIVFRGRLNALPFIVHHCNGLRFCTRSLPRAREC